MIDSGVALSPFSSPNVTDNGLAKERSEFASPPRAVDYVLNNVSDNLIQVFLTL